MNRQGWMARKIEFTWWLAIEEAFLDCPPTRKYGHTLDYQDDFLTCVAIVCNSAQENGAFLSGSQQHQNKLHISLEAEWNRPGNKLPWRFTTTSEETINSLAVSRKSWTPRKFPFWCSAEQLSRQINKPVVGLLGFCYSAYAEAHASLTLTKRTLTGWQLY